MTTTQDRTREVLEALAADPELLFTEVDADFIDSLDSTLRDGSEPLTAASIIRRLLELEAMAR